MAGDDPKLIVAAHKKLEQIKRNKCLDPFNLDSRPTPKQLEIITDILRVICRYVVAANQTGKTTIGAREISWLFNGDHPYLDPKEVWGDRPLTMMVLGRTTKMIEHEIWDKKIKPLLTGKYKVTRIGNVIQSVKSEDNGNTILFVSHNNTAEARQNAQGYVAQYVWLDEMPDNLTLFGELIMRVITTNGRFIATFTPLIKNLEIKKMIEGATEPISKKYKLKMEDNPLNADRMDFFHELYKNFSKEERNSRLYGEWMVGNTAVYRINEEMLETPSDYHPGWRHLESVDPAGSGKAGYVLLAEHPITGTWYVTRAEYVKGDAASKLYREFKILSAGVNLCKEVADPHEVWFIKEARLLGGKYMGVYNKSNRKLELINQVQEYLNVGKVKIFHSCTKLLDEAVSCHWHENITDKIIGSSRFHLLDSLQYGLDNLLKKSKEPLVTERYVEMKRKHRERLRILKLRQEREERKRLPRIYNGRKLW